MEPKQGLQYVSAVTEDTSRALGANGWRVFVLPHDIRDRSTVFAGVRDTPLDPPPHGDRSWDALADSLSGGLYLSADNPVAIILGGEES